MEGAMADLTNFPNHFFASVSQQDSDVLRPRREQRELALRSVLYAPGDQISRVYFPSAGIISLVVGLSDGFMVEAGMFGKNSVVGAGAALDCRVAINQAIVQAAGSTLTIDTGALSKFV